MCSTTSNATIGYIARRGPKSRLQRIQKFHDATDLIGHVKALTKFVAVGSERV